MKNKIIITAIGVVAVIVLLRVMLSELAEPVDAQQGQAMESAVKGENSKDILPSGSWATKAESEVVTPVDQIIPGKPAMDAEIELPTLLEVEEALQEAEPLTAEQVLPEVASLLRNDNQLAVAYRKAQLTEFIDSVEPSLGEIEQAVAGLQKMDIEPARKQAYQQLAEQKMAALRELKQKALSLDADLMLEQGGKAQ